MGYTSNIVLKPIQGLGGTVGTGALKLSNAVKPVVQPPAQVKSSTASTAPISSVGLVNPKALSPTVTTTGGQTYDPTSAASTQAAATAAAAKLNAGLTPTGTTAGTNQSASTGTPSVFNQATQGLVNLGNTPNSTVNAASQGLINLGNTQNPAVTQAEQGTIGAGNNAANIANDYGAQYAKVGQEGANAESGYSTTGLSPVAEGNAAVVANNTTNQQNAITNAGQLALQGTSQQAAGYNNAGGLANSQQANQTSAFNSAGGLGNTAQANQQSALSNAGQLTQKSPTSYGQTVFDPSTGAYTGGSSGVSPSDPYYQTLQNFAQLAATGQYSAIPSSITSNPVLSDQLNQMAKSINPNYSPVASSAQSGVLGSQTADKATIDQAISQASNLQSQASDLVTSFSLNPNELNVGNGAIQKIAENTSDSHYQALSNYLNSIASIYQPILGSQASGQNLINQTAQGTSILSTLDNLKSAAQAKSAGTVTAPTSGSSSNTFTGSSWQ